MSRDRLYHSNLMLLPDGRVMACGSNPARGSDELSIEIYRPPYLFQGERPTIEDAPETIRYGEVFEVQCGDPSGVQEATLIRPTATTHCVNTEQRYVGLSLEASGLTKLRLRAPANPYIAPPGHYMLFLLRNGIPSRGQFLAIAHRSN